MSTKKDKKIEAYFALVLARDWTTMHKTDRKEAIRTARDFGEVFADETAEDGTNEQPSRDSYVRMCVWWAFDEQKVINDVEYEIWEQGTFEDPRVAAFVKGCERRRQVLASKRKAG